jgi:threonine synthase
MPRSQGLNCYVFIPDDLEQAKSYRFGDLRAQDVAIKGNYDDVNRLCSELGDKYGWAFVNVNLRPYYVEGRQDPRLRNRRTARLEAARNISSSPVPAARSCQNWRKAFHELIDLGLVENRGCKIYSAQAGRLRDRSSKHLHRGADVVKPVKPNTIASSIAIGDPAEGYYVLQGAARIRRLGGEASVMRKFSTRSNCWRARRVYSPSPPAAPKSPVTKKLIEQGRIPRGESIVISITGNGYKALDAGAAKRRKTVYHRRDRSTILNALVEQLVPIIASSSDRRLKARPRRLP